MSAQFVQAPFDDDEPPSMDAPALTVEEGQNQSIDADDGDDGEDLQAEEEERGDSFDADEAYEKFTLACLLAVHKLVFFYKRRVLSLQYQGFGTGGALRKSASQVEMAQAASDRLMLQTLSPRVWQKRCNVTQVIVLMRCVVLVPCSFVESPGTSVRPASAARPLCKRSHTC